MFTHRTSIYFQENKFYIFALALGILLFLSGCKSTQFEIMEREVAAIQLTTGHEVSRYAHDEEWGFTGPNYAKISIRYEPINEHTKKEVYDEIVAILEANNWQEDECDACSADSFIAYLPSNTLKVIVVLRTDKTSVSFLLKDY